MPCRWVQVGTFCWYVECSCMPVECVELFPEGWPQHCFFNCKLICGPCENRFVSSLRPVMRGHAPDQQPAACCQKADSSASGGGAACGLPAACKPGSMCHSASTASRVQCPGVASSPNVVREKSRGLRAAADSICRTMSKQLRAGRSRRHPWQTERSLTHQAPR